MTSPGIDPQEERVLIELVQRDARARVTTAAGNEAFERLVAMHQGILWKVVAPFIRRGGVDRDDLYQAALVGLWRGICDFDLTRTTRLMTFAQHWVYERVSKAWNKACLPIYLPAHVHAQAQRDRHAGGSMLSDFVLKLRHAESLDAPVHSAVERETLGDRLPDPGKTEAALLDANHRARVGMLIEQALGDLKPRHTEVLRRRFLSPDAEALEAIAESWGVTRQRVNQIERKAFREFRGWVARNLSDEDRGALGFFERTALTRSHHRASGFRGVGRDPTGRKWEAHVRWDGRARYVGTFTDEEAAARAYDAAARRLLGDKAKLNFPAVEAPCPSTP